MDEFIGLQNSLLYNGQVRDHVLLHTNLAEKQTAKGTKTNTKKKHLQHINYKKVIAK